MTAHPAKNYTVLSLVRHGQVHNPAGILYGRRPGFQLTAAGHCEARQAGQALSTVPLAALFCSPLVRARQTAKAIRALHVRPIRIRIRHLLTEIRSAWEGGLMKNIEAKPEGVYSRAGTGIPFESPRDVFERGRRFVEILLGDYSGRHVAAVTHGDVIAFLLLGIRGVPLQPANKTRLARLGVPNGYPATGSITTLTFPTGVLDETVIIEYRQPG